MKPLRFQSVILLLLIHAAHLWAAGPSVVGQTRPDLDCDKDLATVVEYSTQPPSSKPAPVSAEDINLGRHDPGYHSLPSDALVTPEIGHGTFGVVYLLKHEVGKAIKIPRRLNTSIDHVNAEVEREFANMKLVHKVLPNHSVEPLEIVWAEPNLKAITMKYLSGYVDLGVTGNVNEGFKLRPNSRFSKQSIQDLELIRDTLLNAKIAIMDFHGNLVCDDAGKIALVDSGASAKLSDNNLELAQMKKQFDLYISQVKAFVSKS